MSLDPKDFEGKAVLILGKGTVNLCIHDFYITEFAGNSAFETASNIISSTSFIHLISRYICIILYLLVICRCDCNFRSRLRLACQTHYVGDVR